MFPIIPILALLAIAGGVATLSWYARLSREQQIEADRKMNQLAIKWFQKKYNELTTTQKAKIEKQVEKYFS